MLEGKKVFELMSFISLILFCGLSTVNASWSVGDDIPDPAFNWNYVYTREPFYFIDSADGKIKQWNPRSYFVDGNINASHCSTNGGTGLGHLHFQIDFNWSPFIDDYVPSYSEVNAYWDFVFWSPYICGRNSSPTNQGNCHTFAASLNLAGTYNYWMNPDQMTIALDQEASTASAPYQEKDIIYYPGGGSHSSVIGEVYGGEIKMIYWKYRASRMYYYTDSVGNGSEHLDGLDTPKGYICTFLAYPISCDWDWDGGGDGSSATVYRPN